MVSQIHDDAEERRDRGHALRAGRRRWGFFGETRPINAAQVPVLRGPLGQREANGPDGFPERIIDDVFTMEGSAHLLS